MSNETIYAKHEDSHKEDSKLTFEIGDHISSPSDGTGKLEEIIDMEIQGVKTTFYKVYFPLREMHSMIPRENVKELGIRKLSSQAMCDKVFEVLKKPIRTSKGFWNKRSQEYNAKIYSGSILLLAEVVRDLYICSVDASGSSSYNEKIIYELALERIAEEISIVSQLNIKEVIRQISSTLAESQKKQLLKKAKSDEDDKDFSDFDIENKDQADFNDDED